MTVLGIDDTDSRERGMCTTYLAARLARHLRESGATVERTLLVRLNPAVEHKTRGNAALAVHTDAAPERVADLAADALGDAADGDSRTNPGAVIAPGGPDSVPDDIVQFARDAMREIHTIENAEERATAAGYRTRLWSANPNVTLSPFVTVLPGESRVIEVTVGAVVSTVNVDVNCGAALPALSSASTVTSTWPSA